MINYNLERNKYRPPIIQVLLIAEAPPPSGKTFFYFPRKLPKVKDIEKNQSLPATIFYHYFKTLPKDEDENFQL